MASGTRPGYTTRAKDLRAAPPYIALAYIEAALFTSLVLLGLSVDGGRVTSREAACSDGERTAGSPRRAHDDLSVCGAPAAPAGCEAVVICERYLLAVAFVLIMPASCGVNMSSNPTSSASRPRCTSPMPSCAVTRQPPDEALFRATRPSLGIATVLTPFISDGCAPRRSIAGCASSPGFTWGRTYRVTFLAAPSAARSSASGPRRIPIVHRHNSAPRRGRDPSTHLSHRDGSSRRSGTTSWMKRSRLAMSLNARGKCLTPTSTSVSISRMTSVGLGPRMGTLPGSSRGNTWARTWPDHPAG